MAWRFNRSGNSIIATDGTRNVTIATIAPGMTPEALNSMMRTGIGSAMLTNPGITSLLGSTLSYARGVLAAPTPRPTGVVAPPPPPPPTRVAAPAPLVVPPPPPLVVAPPPTVRSAPTPREPTVPRVPAATPAPTPRPVVTPAREPTPRPPRPVVVPREPAAVPAPTPSVRETEPTPSRTRPSRTGIITTPPPELGGTVPVPTPVASTVPPESSVSPTRRAVTFTLRSLQNSILTASGGTGRAAPATRASASTDAITSMFNGRASITNLLMANRPEITFALFNQLYRLDGFRLYMDQAQGADSVVLAIDPNSPNDALSRRALAAGGHNMDTVALGAAELIRGYLVSELARPRNAELGAEISQLLRSEGGELNADDVVAAALYLRRNSANMARAQLTNWSAPAGSVDPNSMWTASQAPLPSLAFLSDPHVYTHTPNEPVLNASMISSINVIARRINITPEQIAVLTRAAAFGRDSILESLYRMCETATNTQAADRVRTMRQELARIELGEVADRVETWRRAGSNRGMISLRLNFAIDYLERRFNAVFNPSEIQADLQRLEALRTLVTGTPAVRTTPAPAVANPVEPETVPVPRPTPAAVRPVRREQPPGPRVPSTTSRAPAPAPPDPIDTYANTHLAQYDITTLANAVVQGTPASIVRPMMRPPLPADHTFDSILTQRRVGSVPLDALLTLFQRESGGEQPYFRAHRDDASTLAGDFFAFLQQSRIQNFQRLNQALRRGRTFDSEVLGLAVQQYILTRINDPSAQRDGARPPRTDLEVLRSLVPDAGADLRTAVGIASGSAVNGLTIAALSLISWRLANPNANVGEWARPLGFTPVERPVTQRTQSPAAAIPVRGIYGGITGAADAEEIQPMTGWRR